MKDVFLDLEADCWDFLSSLIGDRKLRRGLAVILKQGKEPTPADFENVEDIPQLNFFVDITLKHRSNLLIVERSMELVGHN